MGLPDQCRRSTGSAIFNNFYHSKICQAEIYKLKSPKLDERLRLVRDALRRTLQHLGSSCNRDFGS